MPEPLRLAALDPFGEKRKYWDSEGGEVPARPAEMSQRPTDKNAPAKEVDREAKQDLETADLFSAIDRAIQQMKKANIAFNAPKTLNRDATVTIHLLLSMRETKESLLAMVKGPGEKETATVPVTGIMQAQLSGSNFQLTAITPEEQPISRGEKTEWKWNVKPTTAGEQRLHLTLNAIVTIRGTERKRAIRTFDHTIVVNVTAGQQLADFVSTNWKWLWAAVSAPVAGAVWRNRRKRKSRAVSG